MLFRLGAHRSPRLELLKHVVLFKDLSWHDLGVVDNLLHERHYLAGEVIFDEGEEGQGLFILLSGRVKTTRQGTTRGGYCWNSGPALSSGKWRCWTKACARHRRARSRTQRLWCFSAPSSTGC